tara:strand:- start:3096 stop:3431 length:336 start_codon:yes stop_codon:yes gene_type:complete
MKFEPEHDPDPLNRKFRKVDDINDLPEETKEELINYYASLLENIEILRKTSAQEGVDNYFKRSKTDDAIIKYNAFMQKQISDLQSEIRNMYEAMAGMGVAIQALLRDSGDS